MHHKPKTPSAAIAIATERWPVQCYLQRKKVESQEKITIELPAFALCAPLEQAASPLSKDDKVQETPTVALYFRFGTHFESLARYDSLAWEIGSCLEAETS